MKNKHINLTNAGLILFTLATSTSSLAEQWSDRVSINGKVNVAGFISENTPTTFGIITDNIGPSSSSSDIAVAYATLVTETQINNWARSTIALLCQQASPSIIRVSLSGSTTVYFDKGYITFAAPDKTPFYAIAGRKYINFGGLDNSSFLESTTQLLSLERMTTVEFGFKNWNNLNASAYTFRGLNKLNDVTNNTTRARVFGLTTGYTKNNENSHFNIRIGYLRDITGALYTASTVANSSQLGQGTNPSTYYTTAVPGLDFYLTANMHSFDVRISYIAALKDFFVKDVPLTKNNGQTFVGARPTALSFNVGHSFLLQQYSTRFSIGYQASTEAVALGKAAGSVLTPGAAGVYGNYFAIGMPKDRYYANYNISLTKDIALGFELAKDVAYKQKNGGTGKSTNIGITRLLADF